MHLVHHLAAMTDLTKQGRYDRRRIGPGLVPAVHGQGLKKIRFNRRLGGTLNLIRTATLLTKRSMELASPVTCLRKIATMFLPVTRLSTENRSAPGPSVRLRQSGHFGDAPHSRRAENNNRFAGPYHGVAGSARCQ